MTRGHRDTVTIRGLFADWRQHTDSGWGTGKIKPQDGGADVPIKGVIVGGRPGDSVEVEGFWSVHPTYGRQFTVTGCVPTTPATPDAVVAWMASQFPGVGAKRARAILDHCGGVDALWRVLESDPAQLAAVDGITPDRAAAIAAAYREAASDRDHMIALRGWGLTDAQVRRCCEQWGTVANVASHIRTNPYELCQAVQGFGFKRADVVARRVGIGRDSIERMVAGVVYTLEAAITDGHCYLWGGQLQRMAADVLEVDAAIVGRGIGEAWRRGYVVRRGKRVYSQRLECAECVCADGIARLIGMVAA